MRSQGELRTLRSLYAAPLFGCHEVGQDFRQLFLSYVKLHLAAS